MQDPGNPVDLRPGDLLVVDDVAVCLEVEAVEDTLPPVGFHMLFKVGNRTKRPFLMFSLPSAIRGFVCVDLVGHLSHSPLVLSPG
jgi:hypothetical protein